MAVKKIINSPDDVVIETAEGFIAAYGDKYEMHPEVRGLWYRDRPETPVLIVGGGSGHEPMYSFFIGKNLPGASVAGNVFASPDPGTIVQTAEAAEKGHGVIFMYGNYSGDCLNFDMACEMLEDMGIPCRTVRLWDDVASAPKDRVTDRRGIAGAVPIIKVSGAACSTVTDLDEAFRICCKARDNTWSIGVGLSGGTIPGNEGPAFTLPDDEIEFGLGIHGEPGIRREKLIPADQMVDHLTGLLLADAGIGAGDTVVTYVNGLGSTTVMELCIINRRLRADLEAKGVRIHDMDLGSHVTCQEMAGASISLMKMDDELIKYYDMPCESPFYTKTGR